MGHFWRFLPDVCQFPSRHIGKYVHATEREFFLTKFSKFAVECAWNSKIPQNVRNLGLFWKKTDGFFWKKYLNFFENIEGGKFAVESPNDNIS